MSSRLAALCLATFASAVAGAHAGAQSGSLAIVAGSSTDARGVRSRAVTIAPGVMLNGIRASAWIGASGTMFETQAWSAGGAAAFVARSRSGDGAALTLAASGSAVRTSYDATLGTGEATPAVEYAWRSLSVFAGAHAIVGTTSVPRSGGIPTLPGQSALVSQTRTSIAPVFGAQLRRVVSPTSAIALSARVDAMRVEGVRTDEHTVGLALTHGPLFVSGSTGIRRTNDDHTSYASASASWSLSRSFSLDASGGTYPSNHFTGAANGTYVSAGMTMRFGSHGAATLPQPTGITDAARGVTRLSIRAPHAATVEVAGDWNDWQPAAAQRAPNGVWYADVSLAPGEYRYSFRIDGHEWRVPGGTRAVDDGFGGKSAYITVRGAGADAGGNP